MASGNAKSEDSEFEPDNNFFDNFLDGMDVLMDKNRDSEDERWIAGTDDESTSSGGDRMVIDLPSSPESTNSKQGKSADGSDIKAILTNRVLAHLEKSSSHRRNRDDHPFPSNKLVVDVLDRLKKSVQEKNESSSSSVAGTFEPEAPRNNSNRTEKQSKGLHPFYQAILSNKPEGSDKDKKRPEETMTTLFKWIFSKRGKWRLEKQAGSSRRGSTHNGRNLDSNKDKRKRKRHKKHKSSKSKEEHSVRHRRHKKKSKRKIRKRIAEEEKHVNSDPSLESVSSEDENDILNKHSEEGSEKEAPMTNSVECQVQGIAKQPDCEEGEVFSSSSDWESGTVAKKRRADFIHQQPECFSPSSSSPDGPWLRRCESRRTPSPSWSRQRLRPEDHGRFVLHRMRSPAHFIRMSPCWREQPANVQRVRIPGLRPRSLSPASAHLHPRSPSERDELLPPFVDSFGCPIEKLPPRRIDHLPPLPRPRSPREDVHESRQSFRSYASTESHPREVIPCSALRLRRFPSESDISERREKPSLQVRCLQEIRNRSYKPGRFIYDPDLKDSLPETDRPISRFSSPLYSNQSQMPRLKFTSPTVRHVGTSSSSLQITTSVGCQTDEDKFANFNGDQVSNPQIDASKFSSVISGVTTTDLAVVNPESSSTSAEVISQTSHVPVGCNVERRDFIQEIISHVSVSNKFSDSTSSQRTLEMWKSIVSFRYPDLSEKEQEQVVLTKSMEARQFERKQ